MLALHAAIFLFGLAGVLGKLLSVPATAIVVGRTAVGAVTLLPFVSSRIGRADMPARVWLKLVPSGGLLAIHWVTFFHAVQISSVATGLLAYATFPVFVALLEPLTGRTRIHARDLLFALVVCLGLVVIIPSYEFDDRFLRGVVWGFVSAISFALLTIVNRRKVVGINPLVVGLFQNVWAAIFLSPYSLPLLGLDASQLVIILVLGVFCTAWAHTLFIRALVTIRPQVASVAAALEPVYGIIVAAAFLREYPSAREILGGILIVGVVVASSWPRTGPLYDGLPES